MDVEVRKKKTWRAALGISSVVIAGCGVCCLPLIVPLLASIGASMGLAASFDELSVLHLIGGTGIGAGVFFILRRRRIAAKRSSKICRCENQCPSP